MMEILGKKIQEIEWFSLRYLLLKIYNRNYGNISILPVFFMVSYKQFATKLMPKQLTVNVLHKSGIFMNLAYTKKEKKNRSYELEPLICWGRSGTPCSDSKCRSANVKTLSSISYLIHSYLSPRLVASQGNDIRLLSCLFFSRGNMGLSLFQVH